MDLNAILTAPPDPSEYAPYYGKYIALVTGGNILDTLEEQRASTLALLSGVDDAKAEYRYERGKWTLKEVAGHVNDTERVFAYRALRISRGDQTPIEGFDQDSYVAGSPSQRSIGDVRSEFDTVRGATLALLRQLDADAW